ncbi:MAG: TIGR03936 family radical SAM-associated protein [Actinomycetota bacterium]|nr:TIGR03936 family radical SAM-associated protein [Actinomycetota bacterium]
MGTRQPDGPPPPPTVQRLRIRYAKRGRLRFVSHRDFARAFERALRRSGVPMAFSAGFSPHPKISYVGAAPTGSASEAEYLEIGLQTETDPEHVHAALDEALPEGLDILEVLPAAPGGLPEQIEASHWRIELPGLAPEMLAEALVAFLARDSVIVERVTKKGLRLLDARAAVFSARTVVHDGCAILELVVRQVSPAVRPDDVLTALGAVAGLDGPLTSRSTRLAQGRLDVTTGVLTDPLGPDRAAAARDGAPGET